MQLLEPNLFELQIAGTIGIVAKCPFCGKYPVMRSEYNPDTQIFKAVIFCDAFRCGASLSYNARDRRQAQDTAIERWALATK